MPHADHTDAGQNGVQITQLLQEAHNRAMKEFDAREEDEPYAPVGITSIDGRKKFVKRFKAESDDVGMAIDDDSNSQRYEYSDPRIPFTLIYDRGDSSYRLQHRTLDTKQSVWKKLSAYQAILSVLQDAGYANEASVYSQID